MESLEKPANLAPASDRSQAAGNEKILLTPGHLAQPVSANDWDELVQWIHVHLERPEIDGLSEELKRRLEQFPETPKPLEVVELGRRVAGAYLTMSPGNVVSLGGVRTLAGYESAGTRLVTEYVEFATFSGVKQFQAIIDPSSREGTQILARTGFQKLATIKHLWRRLDAQSLDNSTASMYPELRLLPAMTFTRHRVAWLVSQTFEDTLDCPAINGIREPENILDSFLDGRSLRSKLPWWIAQSHGRDVGCLLLKQHPQQVCELAYLGLIPTARGRGMGKVLLESACHSAQQLGNTLIVAAVDSQNWPAAQLYTQLGFHEHRELEAWFHLPQR